MDGLARFFIEARDFETGARAAVAAQPPKDRAMLRKYYARFGPRAVRLLSTQSRFESQRAALALQLAQPDVANLAGQIRQFYGVDAVPPFVARFLWWPETGRSQAKVRGSMILLQGPAEGGGDAPMDWAPIVLHEYAHHVSAGQSQAQRQTLSAAYLRGCPAATTLPDPLNAFEEPLAIYWGQYRFEQEVRHQALPVAGEWYFKPMPDRIAKVIASAFPATGPAPLLDDPVLMQAATSACRETMKEPGK